MRRGRGRGERGGGGEGGGERKEGYTQGAG